MGSLCDGSLACKVQEALESGAGEAIVTYLDRRSRPRHAITRADLLVAVRVRTRLLEKTFPPKSIVLLVMPPGPEFLFFLLACAYAGMIAVPVSDPTFSRSLQRLDGILADTQAVGVLCAASNLRVLSEHLRTIRGAPQPLAAEDLLESADDQAPACPGLRQSAAEPVILQYTSGSTRQPRGVALASSSIVANAELVRTHWKLTTEKDLLVNWLPHHHDMGLMGGLLFPLMLGGRSVQMSPLAFMQHPLSWLKTISDWKASVSGGPAFAFSLCLENISDEQMEGLDLRCWTTAFCGAEPIPASLLQQFRSRFGRTGLLPGAVFATYGLAETTLLVAGFPDPQPEHAANTTMPENDGARLEACRVSPEMRSSIRIVDPESGKPTAAGQSGEIWINSPSVALGYFNCRPAQEQGVVQEEEPDPFTGSLPGCDSRFLRTGDLGWMGPAGLHISGRLKDILIANGKNVAAVDLEWTAATADPALNPLAAAAVVLSEDAPDHIALAIEVKSDGIVIVQPEKVAEHTRRIVRSEYGLELLKILFVKRGCLERTTSGKIRRRFVANRLRQGHSYPEAIV